MKSNEVQVSISIGIITAIVDIYIVSFLKSKTCSKTIKTNMQKSKAKAVLK